jgi:hypothetical protein
MTMQDIEREAIGSTYKNPLAGLNAEDNDYVMGRFSKLVFGEAGLDRDQAMDIALNDLKTKKQKEPFVRKPDFYEDQSLGARRDVRTDAHTPSADEKIDMDRDTPAHTAYVAHLTEVARGVAERAQANLSEKVSKITSRPDEAV